MNNIERLWNQYLDAHFCTADECGNRPCDNGCICNRCCGEDHKEHWYKMVGEAMERGEWR